MKSMFLFLGLCISGLGLAQSMDIEDRDDSFILENNKNILSFNIKMPFYQIKSKGCTDFQAASFDGGAQAYKALLSKYMFEFLNSDYYSLNGDFTFTLNIDEKGKITKVEGAPKVMFSKAFFEDMNYVVRQINKNWRPAICDGKPVSSHMLIRMNFSSVVADM